jgi:hypothetical protein
VNDRRNTCGQAYGLTVMTPILEGHESALAHYLSTLGTGSASPLASVSGTHFARWVVIGDVVYEGGRQRPEHLRVGRLLFTSNFDGLPEPYLEELRTGLGEVADQVWTHCAGYPGCADADADAFAAYMRSHQIESSLFFAAYDERTVGDVQRSLVTRRRMIEFAVRAQELTPGELQAAFRETFAR